MKNRPIIRSIVLIVAFSAVAFVLFTENVRTVQIIGLLACGAVIGASLTNIIVELKLRKKN